MLRTTLAGLRARKLRLVATALAIVLGVGFVAGTLIFSDTARAALYDGVARFGRGVDVVARTADASATAGPAFDAGVLETLRGVDGVLTASGRMSHQVPVLDKRGKMLGNSSRPGTVAYFGDQPALYPFDVVKGRLPAASGEAALEAKTADRGDFALGDTVTVLDAAQVKHGLTVVGFVDCGAASSIADDALVLLTPGDMATIGGMTGYYSVVATADNGVSQHELAARVRAALPGALRVSTGDDYRFDLVDGSIKQFKPFLYILLLFAGIACIVAVFVIYNTFTILIAQRTRETALLRCIGAGRGQVFVSVLLESVVVGLLGSALGFGLGVCVAYGLSRGIGATGMIQARSLVLTMTPVVVSALVGTVATVVSATVPALRATRVSPLAALGTVAAPAAPGMRPRLPRILLALVIAAGGTALTVVGSHQRGTSLVPLLLVVTGGVVNFLAVLVAAPLFVGPLIAAIGWLPGRLLGPTVRLAAANARRSPGRTAATTAALMIGVGLMSAASVATATVRETADRQVTANYPVDFFLQSDIATGTASANGLSTGLPASLADRLTADRRFDIVARVRTEVTALRDQAGTTTNPDFWVSSFEPRGLAQLPQIELRSGSMNDLKAGTIIINNRTRAQVRRTIGDRVTVVTRSGHERQFTVVGIANGYAGGGDALITWSDLIDLNPKQADDLVLVRAADGVTPKESRAAVLAVMDDYPLATLGSIAEVRAQITSVVDTAIAIVAGLLGFAIIIALIGIMNTLSLSVLERTRESATIRALGLTRWQLRMTLITEALLMALVGALVGSCLGLLYGWATTRVMFAGMDIMMTIPFGQILGYAGIAAAAGMTAAVLPARKAAKSSIVAAMADA